MPPAVCLMVKPVGKPDAGDPHVRFDERGWETGLYATAPILDSTGQPESQFGADYLRKNHLSQKIAELRYIEIIFVARSLPKLVISWSNLKSKM